MELRERGLRRLREEVGVFFFFFAVGRKREEIYLNFFLRFLSLSHQMANSCFRGMARAGEAPGEEPPPEEGGIFPCKRPAMEGRKGGEEAGVVFEAVLTTAVWPRPP